jgi:hypothetical protein
VSRPDARTPERPRGTPSIHKQREVASSGARKLRGVRVSHVGIGELASHQPQFHGRDNYAQLDYPIRVCTHKRAGNVGFRGNSGRGLGIAECPLMTQTGHHHAHGCSFM